MSRSHTCTDERLDAVLNREKSLFARKVYSLISEVPKGRVTTYKQIAEKLGMMGYRAVGNALNRNSHTECIPCHRVVRSDSLVGGYARGVKEKIRILTGEGVLVEEGMIIDFDKKLFRFR
jgi:methylated-DNA-[protein]-cysteine S-methyltransferase